MVRRVLFIGNSFTNRNDLPGTISQLALAGSPSCEIQNERSIANGAALKTHWERGAARELIHQGGWSHVVLQEQSTLPLKNPSRMHEYISLFNDEIVRHGAKTVLYLTWARQDAFHRQDKLSEAYLTIGQKLGATIAPVGIAWQHVLNERLVDLHDRDKSHPNPVGSYLAACVFIAALLAVDPTGLPATAPGLKKLTLNTVTALQRTAWSTVQTFRG